MGPCLSRESIIADINPEVKTVDRILNEEKNRMKNTIKILLLGTGESGKSTILKQMRIIHDNGFNKDELLSRKSAINYQVFETMHHLLQLMKEQNYRLERKENESNARIVIDLVTSGEVALMEQELNQTSCSAIKSLWMDSNVQKCYDINRNSFSDNISHFFDSIDRLSKPDYLPTAQDMLFSRVQTTAVIETNFTLHGKIFRVFDVGGQRTYRKKWFFFFEDVTALLFLVAISEFDQLLREDGKTNRMVESLNLFESTCASQWFLDTAIILFLNKKDLFQEKLKTSSIKIAFPEYEDTKGSQDYRHSLDFISRKFSKMNTNKKKQIYTHETCATDTNQVETILEAVIDICLEAAVKSMGLE